MLKISCSLYRTLNQPAFTSFAARYHYQTELYAKKFEIKDAKLEQELVAVNELRRNNAQLARFIDAYQQQGVKRANLDPLGLQNNSSNETLKELDPATYGLDKNSSYSTEGFLFSNEKSMSLSQIETYLNKVYSSNMSIEFSFINDQEEKLWIAKEFEAVSAKQVQVQAKKDMLKILMNSQVRLNLIYIKPYKLLNLNKINFYFNIIIV